MELNLQRPLVFFDLETTGINVTRDRIIEISYIKVLPGGQELKDAKRINPGMPIPAEATAVHHITDADVAQAPRFEQVARELMEVFADSDIAGYNSNKFDVPLLIEEFARCNMKFDLTGRRFIDVQTIFHKMEQRTLVAAYRFYCGKELEGAHAADCDTMATYEVLKGQLDRYPELKNDVEYLAEFSRTNKGIDLACRFIYNDANEAVVNFGKHKGRTVKEVLRTEPSFFNWMMDADFSKNTKDVLMALRAQLQPQKCTR